MMRLLFLLKTFLPIIALLLLLHSLPLPFDFPSDLGADPLTDDSGQEVAKSVSDADRHEEVVVEGHGDQHQHKCDKHLNDMKKRLDDMTKPKPIFESRKIIFAISTAVTDIWAIIK